MERGKKVEPKTHTEKYDEEVKFEGTLEHMIKMAGITKAPPKNKNTTF